MVYTSCLSSCRTTYDLKKLGNIRKVSKLHIIIAYCQNKNLLILAFASINKTIILAVELFSPSKTETKFYPQCAIWHEN